MRRAYCRRPKSSLLTGVIIVIVGVVLLLDRFGIMPADYIFRFWPMIFVLAGLLKLFRPADSPGKGFGALLVIGGLVLQFSELHIVRIRWDDLWPLILIAVGVMLVWRAVVSRRPAAVVEAGAVDAPAVNVSRLDEFAIFGGGERRFGAREFSGGEVLVIFGGIDLDLRQATMQAKQVTIEANAIFGGVEIRVPETWDVTVRGTGIFGGYGDETRHPRAEETTNHLIVTGVAIFGGIGVKN